MVPADSSVVRTRPRPPHQQQPSYAAQFDAHTVFHDVVYVDGRVVLSGPPLQEFEDALAEGSIVVDGVTLDAEPTISHLDRLSRVEFAWPDRPKVITLELGELSITAAVSSDQQALFRGRKVLMTESQDNHLEWIEDWVRFHVVNHGVDAVLLYDNRSTAYRPRDVLRRLAKVEGIEVAAVVDWPFLFGPQGGVRAGDASIPWDSDFCQLGAMDNARLRFLGEAAGVINADVDELLLSSTGESVFDAIERSTGYVRYDGTWIEACTRTDIGGALPRLWDFVLRDVRRERCEYKWSADPRRLSRDVQWAQHSLRGAQPLHDPSFTIAHLRGINTNWDSDRSAPVMFDPDVHEVHVELAAAVQRAFPGQATGQPLAQAGSQPSTSSARREAGPV